MFCFLEWGCCGVLKRDKKTLAKRAKREKLSVGKKKGIQKKKKRKAKKAGALVKKGWSFEGIREEEGYFWLGCFLF